MYHIPHKTETNKTVCGRPIEVGGRPQVLLTTNADRHKGVGTCNRCKALQAGQSRTAKISAKHRKIREAAPAEKKDRKPGKRQPALLVLGERCPPMLVTTYKGKEYTAKVNEGGTITHEFKTYNSPSRAGKAITGREVDGWTFWSYLAEDGTTKKLDTLRKEVA
ncbi:MAG: hypothetical protein A2Z40_04070 [Deltaproteobacteria bacterium RBG_19FT_COMBO_60_16]|nr:MAG: hypothetical protein A2Z40_04070 [Deltaproteobacteria bacterium RBG_19FT_COMBO_60_16]